MSSITSIAYEDEKVPLKFSDVAILPKSGDNVAVAINVIPMGTLVELMDGNVVSISHTVLEGHRFAVKKIEENSGLYSWGMQFGTALKTIQPGEYLMNERGRKALKIVDPSFNWPTEANFDDRIVSYVLDEKNFIPSPPMELIPDYLNETFLGYYRDEARGVGTRNYVVVISASSLCNSIVKLATQACNREYLHRRLENVDGIVCCCHTEGSSEIRPHNNELVLRTVTGLLVHPNVGAAVVVFHSSDFVTQSSLETTLASMGFDVPSLPISWVSLESAQSDEASFRSTILAGVSSAAKWHRTPQPFASLCVALQCGGSDAFSGITANPLQGAIAEHLIHRGGSAILAETDELMGADAYILDKVSSMETAKAFMATQDHYEALANLHGVSGQANPSGGNFYRGLYNITLKSLGAAMKKTENTRLEGVLKYAERIGARPRGYYFMDTPGNDIESVTGQVAGGCNLIMFSTGNGSITNFPFVPISFLLRQLLSSFDLRVETLLTTSKRYHRLEKDLDINAGRLLEGVSLEQLVKESVEQVIQVAEGRRTFGERAEHSQIQIWRNWYCESEADVARYSNALSPSRVPYAVSPIEPRPLYYDGLRFSKEIAFLDSTRSVEQIAPRAGCVVFPTSLCSGQIAAIIADSVRLYKQGNVETQYLKLLDESFPGFPGFPGFPIGEKGEVTFVESLVHTEGCAEGYGESALDGMKNYDRVAIGHMLHPFSRFVFLVEHGCEKSLLSYFDLHFREQYGVSMEKFGQASVQKDGGIHNTVKKAFSWIIETMRNCKALEVVPHIPIKGLIFGVLTNRTSVDSNSVKLLANVIRQLVQNQCVVVIPENDKILAIPEFRSVLFDSEEELVSSILNGEMVETEKPGVQIMRMGSPSDYVETVTSLGATGASLLLLFSDAPIALSGHPFIPMVRMGSKPSKSGMIDVLTTEGEEAVLQKIEKVLSRQEKTKVEEKRLTDFQILRTMNGFSL